MMRFSRATVKPGGTSGGKWQRDHEGRAVVQPTLRPDLASRPLRRCAGQEQADPESARGGLACFADVGGTAEALAEVYLTLELTLGDADRLVAEGEARRPTGADDSLDPAARHAAFDAALDASLQMAVSSLKLRRSAKTWLSGPGV